eukprot:c22333_g2_i1 orf=76-438(+)
MVLCASYLCWHKFCIQLCSRSQLLILFGPTANNTTPGLIIGNKESAGHRRIKLYNKAKNNFNIQLCRQMTLYPGNYASQANLGHYPLAAQQNQTYTSVKSNLYTPMHSIDKSRNAMVDVH